MNIKSIINNSCLLIILSFLLFVSCDTNSNKKASPNQPSATSAQFDLNQNVKPDSSTSAQNNVQPVASNPAKASPSQVLIYNFHLTNRCPSCIAIEDATIKTLETYFAQELKQGRIKHFSLNVDDDVNKSLCMKYQAYGSGLFVTKVINGKETTTDLTGDGFRFARNKPDRFIEILKNQITVYLK